VRQSWRRARWAFGGAFRGRGVWQAADPMGTQQPPGPSRGLAVRPVAVCELAPGWELRWSSGRDLGRAPHALIHAGVSAPRPDAEGRGFALLRRCWKAGGAGREP